jgi:hypothetical protein
MSPILYDTVILIGDRSWWSTGMAGNKLRIQMSERQLANLSQTR